MADLERAIRIAAEGHAGQRDKAGAPYVLHPIRVMLACSSELARIVAILHDVVEDTDWTLERLAEEGFTPEVLEGLAAVTKRPEEKGTDEGYLAFCRRAAAHPIGREVKRADLIDNMDLSRLGPELRESDLARLRRYRAALEIVDSA